MSGDLAPFPVDDVTLDLLDHALDGAHEVDDDGHLVLVGADMTLTQLLDFLAGYDPAKSVCNGDFCEYPDPLYHPHDVIRALVAEIRRLRSEADD